MTVSEVSTIVRNLVQDFAKSQIPGDIFTYTGSSTYFTLTEPNVVSVTGVFQNGAPLTVTTQYVYDSTTNKVNVTKAMVAGDIIEIQYTYYPNYSAAELEAYVRSAVVYLSVYNYYTFEIDSSDEFFPEVTTKETNLIALVASILIRPDNQDIRLPDMSITNPQSLPTRDIIAKVVRMFKHDTTGMFDIINPYYPPYWMRIH